MKVKLSIINVYQTHHDTSVKTFEKLTSVNFFSIAWHVHRHSTWAKMSMTSSEHDLCRIFNGVHLINKCLRLRFIK